MKKPTSKPDCNLSREELNARLDALREEAKPRRSFLGRFAALFAGFFALLTFGCKKYVRPEVLCYRHAGDDDEDEPEPFCYEAPAPEDGENPDGEQKPEGEEKPEGEQKPEGEGKPEGEPEPEGEGKPDDEPEVMCYDVEFEPDDSKD